MLPRSELESELSVLQRELASIRSSAERSHDLSSRLERESHELKGRIESAKYEEERDRKVADDLEEEVAELAEEVNAQLDELERINGRGGVGRAVGRAMRSISGDAASVGGRSRASSGGGSFVDELEDRLEAACSVDDGGRSADTDGDLLDNFFADEVSVRSGRSRHTTSELDARRSGSTDRASSRRSSKKAPSELQKKWEAEYSSPAEKPQRSTSRGSRYNSTSSDDRKKRYIDQSRREDERPHSRSGTMIRNISVPASRTSTSSRPASVDRRGLLSNSAVSDLSASSRNIAQSIHGLFMSLGEEVDTD